MFGRTVSTPKPPGTPAPQLGKVFISYRRDDTWGPADILREELVRVLGNDKVFLDTEGISHGTQWLNVIDQELEASDILLVVIGKLWEQELEKKRADMAPDFVVHEITSAHAAQKMIIPVLVDGARLPPTELLPENVQFLTASQGRRLHREGFRQNCALFSAALKSDLQQIAEKRAAKAQADRLLAEQERQRILSETQAQERQAEEAARLKALANMAPEDVRKLQELEHWAFVRPRNRIDELREHLQRYPNGETARYAWVALEAAEWARLGSNPGFDDLQAFLNAFPNGEHASVAHAKQQDILRERAAEERRREERTRWQAVKTGNRVDDIRAHLAAYPHGVTTKDASAALEAAVWYSHATPRKLNDVQAFLGEFPAGAFAEQARSEEKRLLEVEARKSPGQRALDKAEANGEWFSYSDFCAAFPDKLERVAAERLYREAGREPLTCGIIALDIALGLLTYLMLVGTIMNLINWLPDSVSQGIADVVRLHPMLDKTDSKSVKVAFTFGLAGIVSAGVIGFWAYNIGADLFRDASTLHQDRRAAARLTVGASGLLWPSGFFCLAPAALFLVYTLAGAIFLALDAALSVTAYVPLGVANRGDMQLKLVGFAAAVIAGLVILTYLIYRGNGWSSLLILPFACIGAGIAIYVGIITFGFYIIAGPVLLAIILRNKYT